MSSSTINLHDLADKIAAALGPAWSQEPCRPGSCWHEATHLHQQDDPQFALWVAPWAGKGKLSIMGTMPHGKHNSNGLRYNEHAVSINVSDTKSPEQIAKDITRRLLPGYQEQYTRAKAAVDAHDTYEAKRETLHATAQALIKAYDSAHPYNRRRCSVHLKSTSDTGCSLDLGHVTLEQLQAILALVS